MPSSHPRSPAMSPRLRSATTSPLPRARSWRGSTTADYRIDLAQGEADVAQAMPNWTNIAAQIEQQKARMAQTAAALAQSGASAEFARQEANRFDGLVGSGAVSLKQAQQAQSEQKRANAAVAESLAMQDQARKQIAVLESARGKATAALKRARPGSNKPDCACLTRRSTPRSPVRSATGRSASGNMSSPAPAC